ncbi:hypothetical protein ElyMa_005224100 [Elysia marginata]|uniref:Uncharacterized protein n=1 Tax=Elysia marginata TaxID=1093978 RepID=A0AAV4JV91_9GAST|nr:hypothetical protein ElyMa_005224100 [Elysia marginata]
MTYDVITPIGSAGFRADDRPPWISSLRLYGLRSPERTDNALSLFSNQAPPQCAGVYSETGSTHCKESECRPSIKTEAIRYRPAQEDEAHWGWNLGWLMG